MRKDKKIAIQLRQKGKSYQEITASMGVPKSTLSNWFSGMPWSEKTKKYLSELARANAKKRMKIISHRRRNALKKDYHEKQIIAKKQFTEFAKERLFIAGLMVYWGEGDSKLANGAIRVANSDPLMIKLFYKFLKTYLPEISKKARIYLVLYPDLNDEECKKYWSKKVGMPLNRFINSSFITGRSSNKRLIHGIGTLSISSRSYKEKIIIWLNLIKQENITRV